MASSTTTNHVRHAVIVKNDQNLEAANFRRSVSLSPFCAPKSDNTAARTCSEVVLATFKVEIGLSTLNHRIEQINRVNTKNHKRYSRITDLILSRRQGYKHSMLNNGAGDLIVVSVAISEISSFVRLIKC